MRISLPCGRSEQTVPGEPGVWVLVCGDMVVFSLFFVIYLYYRAHAVDGFSQSQARLSQLLGALNTLLMLTSSWLVATAVQAARRNRGITTPILLSAALMCGVGFGIVKIVEYSAKFRAGITFSTNDFFMYYFVFTGIHMMHVLIGMAILAVLTHYTWRGIYSKAMVGHLESGAIFWHMVDILWIVLFALLYLVK